MSPPSDTASLPIFRKSDQVFQLSLTELAFIVIFILLILFGWLVQHERERNARLEEAAKDAHDAAAQAAAWGDIRDQVGGMLKNGGARETDIDKVLSDLVERKTSL